MSTRSHIWAERYDRDLEDIFDLQEEITRNVVASIAPQIEAAELTKAQTVRSASFSAYDLALRAQALFYDAMRAGNPEMHQQAIDSADAALQRDPRCTIALWIQAWAQAEAYLYRWGPDPEARLDLAWVAVERFFEIDSTDPRGHMARGIVYHFRGDYDAALTDFCRGHELNQNFALNLFAMAWCESLTGLTDEAREHAALGLRLSPRENELWLGLAYLALAQASFADGDFAETRKWAGKAIQMHPRAPIRRALMIACCVQNGDVRGAAGHVDYLNSFSPDFIRSVLDGDLSIYRLPEHNALLSDGLRNAPMPSGSG